MEALQIWEQSPREGQFSTHSFRAACCTVHDHQGAEIHLDMRGLSDETMGDEKLRVS
jgi:hypothetical protein